MNKSSKPTHCDDDTEESEYARRAREHTIAGGAVGAAGIGSLAVLGVTCPLCVVAAPALICSGVWNAHKDRNQQGQSKAGGEPGDESTPDPRDGTVGCHQC